jgi:hypothetical protein
MAFDRTPVPFFAADGCKKRLEEIDDILSPLVFKSKTSCFSKRLRWPLDKDDTMQEVEALYHYAQLFEFALNIDGLQVNFGSLLDSFQRVSRLIPDVLL